MVPVPETKRVVVVATPETLRLVAESAVVEAYGVTRREVDAVPEKSALIPERAVVEAKGATKRLVDAIPEKSAFTPESAVVDANGATRREVEAIPEKSALVPESAVVEAYGKIEAFELLAMKYEAYARPRTESLANGVEVPMPTLPEVSIITRSEPLVRRLSP